MNRKKKLIRNIVILSLILSFYYFTGGIYLTKESCIMDSVRGLYSNEKEIITSEKINSYEVTLLADRENLTAAIFSTKKTGPFYRIGGSMIGSEIHQDVPIDIDGMFDSDFGSVVYIYRNDKSIEEIEVVKGNGETVMINVWEKDFILIAYEDTDSWTHTICRVYDENHEIVYETAF